MFLAERYGALADLLRPQKARGYQRVRLGRKADGGYVMLNDFDGITVAHSLGVGGEASWDYDAAKRGLAVHMFDAVPQAVKPPTGGSFEVQRIVPAGFESDEATSLTLLSHAVARNTAILKVDIEGAEWDCLDSASDEDLGRWRQIVIELHDFRCAIEGGWFARALDVLWKMYRVFAPVHLHGNNFGAVCWFEGGGFPDVLEVTYANRKHYQFRPSNVRLPTPLDYPNNPNAPEIPISKTILGGASNADVAA